MDRLKWFFAFIFVSSMAGAAYLDEISVLISGNAPSATNPLPVRLTDGTSFVTALPVSQSGSWTVTANLGTIAGVATAANQTTQTTALNSIDGGIPAALGQTTMAASMPVAIASNQSGVPVTDNGGSLTVDGTLSTTQSGTWTVQQGTPPWSVSQSGAWTTGRTWTLLNTADSVNAVQSGAWNITNITGTVSLPTGASTSALQTTGNTILSDIDANGTTIIGNQTNGTQRAQITDGSVNAAVTADDPVNAAQGLVVRNIPRVRETYSATAVNITPAATATDVFTITGSATKTIYIHKITVTGNRTAHAHDLVQIIKRSTANTAGTSVIQPAVAHDSTNAAATATVRSYTANPTLGTAIGTMYARRVSFPVQTPSNAQGNGGSVVPWEWQYNEIGQPIVLRGTSQVLAVNLNAITITGGVLQFSIEWSEE